MPYGCWGCQTLAPGSNVAPCNIAPGGPLSLTGTLSASTTNTTVVYQAVGVVPQQLYTFNLKYAVLNTSLIPPSIQLTVALTGYLRQAITGFSTIPFAITSAPLNTVINGTALVYVPAGIDTIFIQIAMRPVRPLAPPHLLIRPQRRECILYQRVKLANVLALPFIERVSLRTSMP